MSDPSSISGLISTTPKDSSVDENKIATSLIATQAEQEAASVTNKMVSPGRQKYHPGTAKGWLYSEVSGGTPGETASHNVDSITDTDTGDWTVNWLTNFSSADYAAIAVTSGSSTVGASDHAVGSTRIRGFDSNANAADVTPWSIAVFGDQ